MDFFQRQDQARRNTKWLVAYFVAGVSALIVCVYLAAAAIFLGLGADSHRHSSYGSPPRVTLWNGQLFAGVALGTMAVVFMGSLFKMAELSKGGSAVATMLGGRPVSPQTTDPAERKLLNVVEEMAIASGIPVPQVYLLPQEQGINAFAAGHSTSDAVIGVTRGSVQLLSRDELQGVIGHEFSHILNGDMRLNMRLIGFIFGILCLAVIGRILLETRSRSSKDKNPLPLLGLALLVIGWVGIFFGRLIQAAVSRQREFLADASAVQFTRNPEGLAGALKKIGGLSYGSKIEAAHADEASHMFFGNGMRRSLFGLMDTHPPLAERIKALDPAFDGKFPRVEFGRPEPAPVEKGRPARPPVPFPLPGFPRAAAPIAGLAASPVIAAATVSSAVGAARPRHIRFANELGASLPPMVQAAAREAMGATTLVYALLLSSDQNCRTKQLTELEAATSRAVCEELLRIEPQVREVATRAKLPLMDLALPALRLLSPGQFQQFRTAVQKLVDCDGEIDLFEYVLQKIVMRHLEPQFFPPRRSVVQYYALKPLLHECSVLLSALAYVGQDEAAQVEQAFAKGAASLAYAAQTELKLVSALECDLGKVDGALERLSLAVPQIRKNVLNACAETVAADGVIQETEAEMLRAVADGLDCPLPPFVAE
jgi:Zn-dependent protease with chaperone function